MVTTWLLQHFELYLLVLLRVVAFVAASPLMSTRSISAWAKIGLAAFTAAGVAPSLHAGVPAAETNPGDYVIAALRESVVGLLMGFVATLVFSVVSIAGQLFDIQVGFGSAQLFDPGMGETSGVTSTFLSVMFSLCFLGLNGLDGLLLAVMNSYRFIPLDHIYLPAGFWQFMIELLGMVSSIAIQLVAPLFAALLLTDITFALLSRAVPQMNVFVVGLPAKLFVGLTLFAGIMPGVVYIFGRVFAMLFSNLDALLQLIGGGVVA